MACITLLSDFGQQDATAAVARGVLMQHNDKSNIIDISHDVTPFHTGQAAYLLATAYKNFPEGTCHVLLFDLFSEAVCRLVLCRYKGHYFLTPDNGLLPLALGLNNIDAYKILELKSAETFNDWLHTAAIAIHGLQEKKDYVDYAPYLLKAAPEHYLPLFENGKAKCEVIHVDHYENVVINVTRQQFESIGKGRSFQLQFIRVEEINEISNNYSDVKEGYKLCRFNSNDYLEICVNRGKAASLFGLRLGGKHNNIKISFE